MPFHRRSRIAFHRGFEATGKAAQWLRWEIPRSVCPLEVILDMEIH